MNTQVNTQTHTQFDHVSVVKKANVYFDGKCVSHTVLFPDGSQKTVGVIFPSLLKFSTNLPEIMEVVAGKCRVRIANDAGESSWQVYENGQSFHVPGASSFELETLETLHYVCHFVAN